MQAQSIALSEVLGSTVSTRGGVMLGRVRELAMSPQDDPQCVSAFIVRTASGDRLLEPAQIEQIADDRIITSAQGIDGWPKLASSEGFLLLERDLLDQQIIDVNGRKVVRVNDAMLHAEAGVPHGLQVRVTEVEVGTRGALRRLLRGIVPKPAVEKLAGRFAEKAIPWHFVDLIETDPARRVRLRIEQDRLAKLHPADIADILEELAPAEREAVFENLDEEVAAEALEEVDPKLQASLLNAVDSEHAADIVEEMDPDAAADVLAELSPEKSEEILGEMEPEEREEVSELLAFEENTAAGRMTTDLLWTFDDQDVAHATDMLRKYEGQAESIHAIFLVDQQERLTGAVPISKLMIASSQTKLAELKDEPLVFAEQDTAEDEVAELFDKYNLLMLPVVNQDRTIAGAITVDDVISFLRRNG